MQTAVWYQHCRDHKWIMPHLQAAKAKARQDQQDLHRVCNNWFRFQERAIATSLFQTLSQIWTDHLAHSIFHSHHWRWSVQSRSHIFYRFSTTFLSSHKWCNCHISSNLCRFPTPITVSDNNMLSTVYKHRLSANAVWHSANDWRPDFRLFMPVLGNSAWA